MWCAMCALVSLTDLRHPQRHGQGVHKSADGLSVYEGEWAENKRNGKGKLTVKNEYTYEGDWKLDAKAGVGALTRTDGTVYEGCVRFGVLACAVGGGSCVVFRRLF